MNALLALGARYAQPLLIAALLAVAALCAVGEYQRLKLKVEVAEYKAALSNLVAHYNETAREADARERDLRDRRESTERELRGAHAKREAELSGALHAALDGLRHSADADRRRAMQPAGSAPADCRNYAADPRNLSLPDSELLVRIGDAAERVAGVLAYCDGYVGRVVPRSEREVTQ